MQLLYHKKIIMTNRRLFYIFWIVLIGALLFAYSKSYDNEFHFDDSHTIIDNPYVRDINNIPLFFSKGSETFSSLPLNQMYRPVVTSSIAIDYWLSTKFSADGSGYDPHYYHYSMMLSFFVLLVLMYLLIIKLFDKAQKTTWNQWAALFATAWYGLHTVNAETINYIISRSDLLSTLFVIAAFVIYLYFPAKRKWGLFLLPIIIGLFTKLTAAMFFPLLIVYFALFEYPLLREVQSKNEDKKKLIIRLLLQAGFLIIIIIVGVGFIIGMQGDSFTPGGTSRWLYLITQPYILFHYFVSFFYPYNLSADTDMGLVSGILDWHLLVGVLFIIGIVWFAIKKGIQYKYAPFTFGIIWFFISLAPTSSLIPLAEVANDHRMFFPFVGLMISVVWFIFQYIWNHKDRVLASRKYQSAIYMVMLLILLGHIIGVRQRVEVWDNGESLWLDVTKKSPTNGRGWMNYGLKLMSDGNYEGAMNAYEEALKHAPKYSYLYTNIAICQNAIGKTEEAEENYKLAIQYGYYSHKPYYFYADFLKKKKRYAEAIQQVLYSQELAPEYVYSFYLLMEIYAAEYEWDKLSIVIQKTLSIYPNDKTAIYYQEIANNRLTQLDVLRTKAKEFPTVDNFLNLSLEYYNVGDYDSCIYASNLILELDPNSVLAYNNICAANNQLRRWDLAIIAGKQGLSIDSESQFLINNLAVSIQGKESQELWKYKTADELIAISLEYYTQKNYQSCIDACMASIEKKPNNAIAYNNICSAFNAMQEWGKAVEYGKLAVKYGPDFQLAKNNLAYAESMLNVGK